MNLAELVDKIDLIVSDAPNINTFLFDDLETINELHATSYPLLLLTPTEDEIDARANEQDYNLDFYLMDTYFQDDAKTLRQKYSDMQIWGIKMINELIDDPNVRDVGNITVNRGQERYNDHLVLVQFSFTVRVYDCMKLLKKPTSLVATTASSSQIDLTWTDVASDESNYEVSRSLDNSTWTTIDTIAADSSSYSATGLDPSTLYYFRVRATTASNRSAYSNTDSDTTSA